jgi:hypothetical protein
MKHEHKEKQLEILLPVNLRDYFACRAMELFIDKGKTYVEQTAQLAYEQADAMMRAREV